MISELIDISKKRLKKISIERIIHTVFVCVCVCLGLRGCGHHAWRVQQRLIGLQRQTEDQQILLAKDP